MRVPDPRPPALPEWDDLTEEEQMEILAQNQRDYREDPHYWLEP